MQKLQEYLRKFLLLTPAQKLIKEAALKVIKDTTGIALSAAQVNVQGSILMLHTTPACRSEILLRKQALLAAFQITPGAHTITDVR